MSATSTAGPARPGVPGNRAENASRAGMRYPRAEARAKRGRQGKRSYAEAEAQGRAERLGWRRQGPRHSPVMLPVWVLTDRPAPALSRFCICPASFIPSLAASAAQNTSGYLA